MNKHMLLESLDRVAKSWWTLVAGLVFGIAAGSLALQYMPKTYQAATTVLVIPPQIPETLMRSTVTDDMSMRLRALREAVLSRPYMEQLVNDVYGEDLSMEEVDSLIRSISRRMEVTTLRIDPQRGGGVFQLSFRDNDRNRVAEVVNRLTRLYIDQNVRFRTVQAEGTAETIRNLLVEVEQNMEEKEQEIATYRQSHLYETQEHYTANIQLLNSRQSDLESNLERQGVARDRLDFLRTQKDQADWTAMNTTGSDRTLDPRSVQLRRLQTELKNLEAKYSENHPDVIKKRRELAAFLNTAPADAEPGGEDGAGEDAGGLASPALLAQLDSLEKELVRLDAEESRIRQDIANYTKRIENTPKVAQALDSMNQEYEDIRQQVTNYRDKLENARAAKEIEENQQGERFEIIQDATAPFRPVSPVPLMVYAACVLAGLFLCVAPVLIRVFVNPLVSTESALADRTESPILISIPRILTPEYDHENRRILLKNLGLSVMSIIAGSAVLIAVL